MRMSVGRVETDPLAECRRISWLWPEALRGFRSIPHWPGRHNIISSISALLAHGRPSATREHIVARKPFLKDHHIERCLLSLDSQGRITKCRMHKIRLRGRGADFRVGRRRPGSGSRWRRMRASRSSYHRGILPSPQLAGMCICRSLRWSWLVLPGMD